MNNYLSPAELLASYSAAGVRKMERSAASLLLLGALAGAIIAAKHGLPKELIHLVATHSFEGEKSYKTVEHFIVKTSEGLAQKFLSFKFGADGFRPMSY